MRPTLKHLFIGLISAILFATVIFTLATGVRYIAKESLPEQAQE